MVKKMGEKDNVKKRPTGITILSVFFVLILFIFLKNKRLIKK
jgi:hypothetical protein